METTLLNVRDKATAYEGGLVPFSFTGPAQKPSGFIQRIIQPKPQTRQVTLPEAIDLFIKEFERYTREGREQERSKLIGRMADVARRVIDKAWNGWLLLAGDRRLRAAGIKTQADLDKNKELSLAVSKWYAEQLEKHVIDQKALFRELEEERAKLPADRPKIQTIEDATQVIEGFFDVNFAGFHRLAEEALPRLRSDARWEILDRNLIDLLGVIKEDKQVRAFHDQRRRQRSSRVTR